MPVTVVNPHHWLNPDGTLPDDTRLRNRILRVARCIEYAAELEFGEGLETLIPCRRRPGNKACRGLLWVVKQPDEAIFAYCGECREDEYLIHSWHDTLWGDGPMVPVQLIDPTPDSGLGRALYKLQSVLTERNVRDMIPTAPSPTVVIQRVLASIPRPPTEPELQHLVAELMTVWNQTPRPELGDRAPDQISATRTSQKIGRNAKCPCGSGKKYKRCCLQTQPVH